MADVAASAVERGHEPDRLSLRKIVVAALAILGVIVLGVLLAYMLVNKLMPHRGQMPPQTPPPIPGAPRLQDTPELDRATYQREKESLLHGYAWVDRAQGVVRIPIDQAMTLLVQQHQKAAAKP